MEVVNKIAAISTGASGPFPSDVPREAVVIEEARLITSGAAEPASQPSQIRTDMIKLHTNLRRHHARTR